MRKNLYGFARIASTSAVYTSLEAAVCSAQTVIHNLKYHYLYPDNHMFREDLLQARGQSTFCDDAWIQAYSSALRKGDKTLCRSVMQEMVTDLRKTARPKRQSGYS